MDKKMNKQPIVTVTTDFCDDFSLAQLKAELFSINPGLRIITISNNISKYSILEGAFVLSSAHSYFPEGSLHLGIIDPGVGSRRQGIIIKSNHTFVGPNNGLFSPSIKNKRSRIYRINDKDINDNHSNTFHGRDIFARVAGLLSMGKNPLSFAEPMIRASFVNLSFKENQVLYVDPYGNIKINNSCRSFKFGDKLKLQTDNSSVILPFVNTFSDVPSGEFLAYKGSNQTLEIAINMGSANEKLRLRVGEITKVAGQN